MGPINKIRDYFSGELFLLTSLVVADKILEDRQKKKRAEKLRARHLYKNSFINPKTMQVEHRQDNFAIQLLPVARHIGSIVGSAAAFIGVDRAIDDMTSVERKARNKIKKKWDKEREKDLIKVGKDFKNGDISKADYYKKIDKIKKFYKDKSAEEYERWKTRENLIKESARDYYNKLQEELPTSEVASFSLLREPEFKQLIKNEDNKVIISPDIEQYLRLDVTKNLIGSGVNVLKRLIGADDKIKNAVKRLILLESKIETLSIPSEQKEVMKFEAFKNILAEFPNPGDVEKILKIKEKIFGDKKKENKTPQKKSQKNFNRNITDSGRFPGWQSEV